MRSTCEIEGCEYPVAGRGLCISHYDRLRTHGDPLVVKRFSVRGQRGYPALSFWSRVDFTPTCWLWTGDVDKTGYGRVRINKRSIAAHRWAYEFCREPIPDGLIIDHLCRVRACVNPDHLEATTHSKNVARGDLWQRRKTHCPQGHPYAGENVRFTPRMGRICRTCAKAHSQAKYARRTSQTFDGERKQVTR